MTKYLSEEPKYKGKDGREYGTSKEVIEPNRGYKKPFLKKIAC